MKKNLENVFKNKNILITGISGFIGTNLSIKLNELGANITGVIHKHPAQIQLDGINYINADLTINNQCTEVCKNIDYVFMCAANTSGAAVIQHEPLTHLTPNVVMNSQMLAAAYKNKVKKFVFISSNTVYPLTETPVSEADTTYTFYDKYHIVGWMKLFSEEMCKMYSNHISNPMETLIVRPGNLYGPYDKYTWKESKVIAAIIRRFAEDQNPLDVWGDGKDIKDFLYIDDFIEGLLLSFISEKIQSPINIASGEPSTIQDVIEHLKKITDRAHLEVKYDATKPSMIPIRLINVDYIKENLHWSAKNTLYEGLMKTFKWYKERYKNDIPEEKNDYC